MGVVDEAARMLSATVALPMISCQAVTGYWAGRPPPHCRHYGGNSVSSTTYPLGAFAHRWSGRGGGGGRSGPILVSGLPKAYDIPECRRRARA